MVEKQLPQVIPDIELAKVMDLFSSPLGSQMLAPVIDALINIEAETQAWLSHFGEKEARIYAKTNDLRPHSYIRGARKSHHFHDDEKTNSALFKRAAASVAVQQEIEAHFMEEALGEEGYEVLLSDPLQDKNAKTKSARVVFYNSDSNPEKGVPDVQRFMAKPDELSDPKLTIEEEQILANPRKRTRSRILRGLNTKEFGKDNNDVRI